MTFVPWSMAVCTGRWIQLELTTLLVRRSEELYYDGFMDDIESVLEQHHKYAVIFYGTRNSSGAELDKENVNSSDKIYTTSTHYEHTQQWCRKKFQ